MLPSAAFPVRRSLRPRPKKGDRHLLPERPFGCFAQKVPVTFFTFFLRRRCNPSKGGPTVRWKKRSLVGQVMVVCLLMVGSSGCCCWPRHGVIVHRGSSLEMNRVPWVVSRTDAREECSGAGVDCVVGCLPEGKVSACHACASPTPAPPSAVASSCRPQKGRGRRLCGRCGQASCGGPVQPVGATEPYRHPRFHPVPTRPVFSPREDCLPGTEANVVPHGGVVSLGTVDGRKAPPVEGIPAPMPEEGEGWRAKHPPQSGDSGSSSTSSPSVDLKLGPIGRNQSD